MKDIEQCRSGGLRKVKCIYVQVGTTHNVLFQEKIQVDNAHVVSPKIKLFIVLFLHLPSLTHP